MCARRPAGRRSHGSPARSKRNSCSGRAIDDASTTETKPRAGGGLTVDEVLWSFHPGESDPEDFERFAKVFPNSRHAAEATERSQVKVAALTERGLYINGALASTSISADAGRCGNRRRRGRVRFPAGRRARRQRDVPGLAEQAAGHERGMKALVTECDLYAADPNDPQRAVPGVTNGLVNIRDALRACAFALAADSTIRGCNSSSAACSRSPAATNGRSISMTWPGAAIQRGAGQSRLHGACRVGRDVDYERAFDYYIQAAALGNLRARTNIGTAYIRGQGVPEMPEEGVLWYRLAASSGWTNAITALGDSYGKGVGVQKIKSRRQSSTLLPPMPARSTP